MSLSLAMFEAPPRPAVPTAKELQAFAAWGAKSGERARTDLMNIIGRMLGIPSGGWERGQSRLFDGNDVRVVWLLRRLAHANLAKSVSQNLDRVTQFVSADVMLTIVVAAYDESKTFQSQLGQKFGCFTALTYLSATPPAAGTATSNLFDRAFADEQLNSSEWVRIAKARVAEALYMERLLTTTRELLPF